ncbi:acyltransferase family protein [Lacinutrix neustonica]|uniref:Acyltransferase family protein n=1 Tax=Lacinutrix neustonica TaxID=2980107 RepID=A0A9E8MZD7_9FLAO|nr:acyltransferase family protein [Lacinutrix neustonica]WAC03796.1 acyltransferase family protein [Lacinutrix neustonica]
MKATSRNILLDIFKIIVALFVIALHCRFLLDLNPIIYQIFGNGIFKIAIPLFFCVNGFFLFNVFKRNHIKIWVKRVGVLYVIWMLIYSYLRVYLNDFNLLKMIAIFLFGFNHLWYLAALFLGGILLYPFRNASNNVLIISAICLYSIGIIIQYLGVLHELARFPLLDKLMSYPPLHRNFLFYAWPFLSIGYVIRRSNFHTKFKKATVIILINISFLALVIDCLVNFYYLSHEVILNMNLSFLLFGPVLLITAFSFQVRSKLNSKLLSSYSIAIYLVHPLIIFLIFNVVTLSQTALTVATIILSVIASYFLIWLNSKLKYIL